MIIYTCGPLGYRCAAELYKKNKAEIDGRFPSFFVKQFNDIGSLVITKEQMEHHDINPSDLCFMTEIGEGGIYRALWEAGEALGCGMRIDNPAIPIRQEVIEILELFDESPYECDSQGSWLIVLRERKREAFADGQDDGRESRSVLDGMTEIGCTTSQKARVLVEGENERFLTPPSRQAKDILDRAR